MSMNSYDKVNPFSVSNSSSTGQHTPNTRVSQRPSITKVNVSSIPDLLGKSFSEDIRPFIDAIDTLRRDGLQQDIDLPRVVVLGDQSSGKSSIIEAISGIELPRGKGIVTRCPLELQLHRVPNQQWKATLSYKDKKTNNVISEISSPSDVEKYVREAQDQICGNGNSVNEQLITLKVESPADSAPDLTLIDLPGIARTAVTGQHKDICSHIRTILNSYIQHKNTIILCVVAANLDAAVNESISMARQYDARGERTFGVITKPDTVSDESMKEDVLCLLNNEKIQLDKGFLMVKCRSQKQLDEKMSLSKSLENEKTFFKEDKLYKTVNKYQLGIENLAKKITEELVTNIKNNLPRLNDDIKRKFNETNKILEQLGLPIPDNNQEKLIYLITYITKINDKWQENFKTGKIIVNEISIFSYWRNQFELFKKKMDDKKKSACATKFTETKLEAEIKKRRGFEIEDFLDYNLFRELMIEHLDQYKCDAQELVKGMISFTEGILNNDIKKETGVLKNVELKLKGIILEEINLCKKKIMERIDEVFVEETLIFTLDETFQKEKEKLIIEKEKREAEIQQRERDRINQLNQMNGYANNNFHSSPVQDKDTTPKETFQNSTMMILIIKTYLEITNQRLGDSIPMIILKRISVDLMATLRIRFLNYATKPEVLSSVNEDPRRKESRKSNKEKLARLEKAKMELEKIQFR